MKAPPDNCMVCSSALEHNSKTFGGLTAQGATVLPGECCVRRLKMIMAQGVYATKYLDSVPFASRDEKQRASPEAMPHLIDSIQSHFNGLDSMASAVM